jgi:hypothetical protein
MTVAASTLASSLTRPARSYHVKCFVCKRCGIVKLSTAKVRVILLYELALG